MVQVKAKESWTNHELESSGGGVYIVSCSTTTAEGQYRDGGCYTQISRPEIVISKAGFVRCELVISKVHVCGLGGNLEARWQPRSSP